jgi:hypothetical protein
MASRSTMPRDHHGEGALWTSRTGRDAERGVRAGAGLPGGPARTGGGQPRGPGGAAGRARRAVAGAARRGPRGGRGAGHGRRAGTGCVVERPLLRLRDRRRVACGAGRRLAHHHLGPERRAARRRPRRRRGRGGRRALAGRVARAPGPGVGRLRHRRTDGELHRPRRRQARGARPRRPRRRGGRAHRRAAAAGARGRGAPRHHRPGVAVPRPGHRRDRPGRRRRAGPHAAGCVAAGARWRGRAGDRLRAGRQRQHRRRRPAAGDLRARPPGGGVGAR